MDIEAVTGHYQATIYRMVESQEQVATMEVVDTLDEQALLEALLESSKPTISSQRKRHYLIQSPFRYPPLKHGSRFGTRFEPSIFYAGQTLQAAMCESAFYSFYFMSRSVTPFEQTIINHKTTFGVKVDSEKHVYLTQVSDADIQKKLVHQSDYTYTQQVGKRMREVASTSFSYQSARCTDAVNVGVFDIDAIKGKPFDVTHWQIKQTHKSMQFLCEDKLVDRASYLIDTFLVDGVLPHPSV